MARKDKAPPPPPPVPLGRHLLAFLGLALLVFAVYSPALRGEFQFDDAMGIERGLWKLPKGREVAGILHTLKSWTGRGLVQASYQLNYWMAGGNEMKFLDLNRITLPFHVFSILFHLLAVGALYALLAWMASRRGRPSLLFPLLGAGLLALHPLAAESVAYISSRSGSMVACIGLWAVLGFAALGARRRDGTRASLGARGLAVALLGVGTSLAVACKETGWMIPPMALALLLWAYHGERRALWQDWGWGFLAGGLLFAAGVAYYFSHFSLVDGILDQYRATYGGTWGEAAFRHVCTQMNAWFTVHLPRLLCPWGPWHLTVDPAPPLLTGLDAGAGFRALLQGLAVLAAAVWAWRAWSRGSPAGLGAAWIAMGIVPVSAAALLDVTTERHAYMPLVGAALALAALLERLARRRWLLAAAALCLCVLTARRACDWATEEALWRAAIRDAPAKPRPWYNWAKSLNRRAMAVAAVEGPKAGDLVAAAQVGFRSSLKLFPGFHIAHSGMARTCQWQGRREEAVAEYRLAISSHEEALWRGEAVNMHAQQITVLSKALAALLHDLGRDDEAEQAFLQPIGYHLGALRRGVKGMPGECHQWGAADLLRFLVLFQHETGQAARARQTLGDALRMFPDCPPLLELKRRLGEKR